MVIVMGDVGQVALIGISDINFNINKFFCQHKTLKALSKIEHLVK